jgi:hypothetical protein
VSSPPFFEVYGLCDKIASGIYNNRFSNYSLLRCCLDIKVVKTRENTLSDIPVSSSGHLLLASVA